MFLVSLRCALCLINSELPKEVPYLIIGAGTAAYAAYRAIRAGDGTAKVRTSLSTVI